MDTQTAVSTAVQITPAGLMSVAQAAEYLGIKRATLDTWRSTNRCRLPYVKLSSHVKYRKQDLDAFIEAGLRNAA